MTSAVSTRPGSDNFLCMFTKPMSSQALSVLLKYPQYFKDTMKNVSDKETVPDKEVWIYEKIKRNMA